MIDQDIQTMLKEHEERITKLEQLFQGDGPKPVKQISPREFMITKKPKGYVEKTIVLIYYLEFHEKNSPANVNDIEGVYRAAKEPLPSNLNDQLYKAVKRGLVMESKEKKDGMKAWVLSGNGEDAVNAMGDQKT